MKNPLVICLLSLILGTFTMFGCPSPNGGDESRKLSGQTVDTSDALQEDVYRFPIPSNPMTLDPAHVTDTVSDSVTRRIFDGLVRFDADGRVSPSIADKWEASPDGKTWKFYLKEGVKFHNGRTVTSQDFVYSFTRLLNPATQSERAGLLYPIKGARAYYFSRSFPAQIDFLIANQGDKPEFHETLASIADTIKYVTFAEGADPRKCENLLAAAVKAKATSLSAELTAELNSLKGKALAPPTVAGITAPDDATLQIELEEGYAPFLMVLGMTNCYVVPKEEVEKYADDFGQHPVGTGPFMFQSWEADVSVLLAANRLHFRKPPGVDKLLFRIISDENTRFEEFKNGQLEHTDVPSGRMGEVKRDDILAANLMTRPAMDMYGYCFNCSKPPFKDNKLLRKAINHAIDKDDIIANILEGKFKRMDSYVPEGTFYYWADSPGYKYDIELAKKLLAEAGYPGGQGLPTITLNIDNQEFRNKIAVAVQEDLRNIGINIEINRKDWGTFLEQVYAGETVFCQNTWLADYPDPDNWLFTLLDSSQAGAPGNISRYSNPEFDKLVREAQRTVDQNLRADLYRRAESIALEDAPWVLLFVNSPTMLVQPYVKNLKLTPMDRAPQLTNCPIEEVTFDRS
ncbi:MAG: ABC transporter substrate-binding protein [bacterium]|jgi:peptide/nickel transport system substrate-binding protein/oligopeptide transport system substrate-binding protein